MRTETSPQGGFSPEAPACGGEVAVLGPPFGCRSSSSPRLSLSALCILHLVMGSFIQSSSTWSSHSCLTWSGPSSLFRLRNRAQLWGCWPSSQLLWTVPALVRGPWGQRSSVPSSSVARVKSLSPLPGSGQKSIPSDLGSFGMGPYRNHKKLTLSIFNHFFPFGKQKFCVGTRDIYIGRKQG